MKRFKSKSVLYHYLVSFISIVMFSCTIIGITSYLTAAQELRTSAEKEQRKRLQLAVEDLNAQFEMLQEISFRVQISPIYLPSNIKLHPYHEIELLEDFGKYNGYSSLYTYYFLHYRQIIK